MPEYNKITGVPTPSDADANAVEPMQLTNILPGDLPNTTGVDNTTDNITGVDTAPDNVLDDNKVSDTQPDQPTLKSYIDKLEAQLNK